MTMSDRARYCPVCGYKARVPPWGVNGDSPTHSICPCCGVQWGYQDLIVESRDEYRDGWLAAGAHWDWDEVPHDGLTTAQRLERIGIALGPS